VREKIKNIYLWLKHHERHLSSFALLSGFIVDAFTLRRVDLPFENILLISYFFLIAVGILILHITDSRAYKGPFSANIPHILPLVIQFAFGGLFSGFTIFYFRSGSVAASWPFILILVGLLLGNELLRRHYARLVFQVTTLFTALFFFNIFFIPVLVARMGPWIFILSGLTTLILTSAFIYILNYFVPQRVRQSKQLLIYWIAGVYVVINGLYFMNLIPPIPLSLKDAGVYHSVTKSGGGYFVLEEEHSRFSWLQFFEKIHIVEGDPVYVYSAVFAPTHISTDVVHHWRYFDTSVQRWVSVSRIPYTIAGGADRGHRGYSIKSNLNEGDWAVDVETPRGQVIGRILFEVIYVSQTPEVEAKVL
jgi:hypothetical protein